MEIISYPKFKKSHRLYSKNVAHNLYSHGFTNVYSFELEPGDKSLDIVNDLIKQLGITSDVVFRRTTDSWRCPYLEIYIKRRIPKEDE